MYDWGALYDCGALYDWGGLYDWGAEYNVLGAAGAVYESERGRVSASKQLLSVPKNNLKTLHYFSWSLNIKYWNIYIWKITSEVKVDL